MSKRKLSDREFLIEQCLQDAYYNRNEDRLDEGWWENIKASANGAKEWLKADLKDSFTLKSKQKIKKDRTKAKMRGKAQSYAISAAKMLLSFVDAGGKIGNNIKDIHDVIIRLKRFGYGRLKK